MKKYRVILNGVDSNNEEKSFPTKAALREYLMDRLEYWIAASTGRSDYTNYDLLDCTLFDLGAYSDEGLFVRWREVPDLDQ